MNSMKYSYLFSTSACVLCQSAVNTFPGCSIFSFTQMPHIFTLHAFWAPVQATQTKRAEKQNRSMRVYILRWWHSRLKSCGTSHRVMGRAIPGVPRDRSAFTTRVKTKATQIFRTTHPTTQHHTEDNLNAQQHQCFTYSMEKSPS